VTKDFHTLLIRIDRVDGKKLKMIAANEDTSMNELVKEQVEGIVKGRERRKAYREMFAAAGL
jgi:predicted HicB family RNase H-like nuclease